LLREPLFQLFHKKLDERYELFGLDGRISIATCRDERLSGSATTYITLLLPIDTTLDMIFRSEAVSARAAC
jgi:hypothetical protein